MYTIIPTILLAICLILFIHYTEKDKKELLSEEDIMYYLKENYNYIIDNIILSIKEEFNIASFNSSEEYYCDITLKIYDSFIDYLINNPIEDVLISENMNNDYLNNFVNISIMKSDIMEICKNYKWQWEYKGNDLNDELAIERVSNHIKSDSSTIDITNDLQDIFFND